MNLKNLIYIKPTNSSFINIDQKILEKHFHLTPFLLNQNKGKVTYFFKLFILIFVLLLKAGQHCAFICWFGDYHAAVMVFIAKLMGKRSIIFAGGQETICYKELGKGVYLKKLRGSFVKYALRNCSLIIPNHESLVYHKNYFYNPEKPHIDGIKHYVKGIKGDIIVVHNGIDTSRINRDTAVTKDPKLVLTVGTMNKQADFINKGFDLFIGLARRCKTLSFVMIGVKSDYLPWIEEQFHISEIKNLKVIPSSPVEVLNEYYNRASVYLQISITEGMPNSLGEAMLCECVPIGSNVNGIPDVIGNTGLLVYKRDLDELEKALNKAISMNTGSEARDRMLENFSIEKREKHLIEILESHFNN
jgi:glycosyltransferase involved in cell wall biosynthesis